MRNSVPFISDTLGKIVPQIAGQITMVGAISGTGKSTTTAAIAHRNYTAGKKTLIISNEESTPKILSRIACIEEDISFNDYFTDLVSTADRKRVAKRIDDIKNFVTPVDHPLASTCVERVVDYLSKASKKGYSLAIVDFLQRIVRSETNPTAERVHTLMTFKDLLTDYSGSHSMPVVVMAQLKPMEPDEQDRNIQTRIGWSTGFYECCANVIEAIKIDNIPVTTYHIQKGRFSGAKKLWSPHEFKNGSFVPISKSRVTELRAKEKDKQVQDSLEELLGDKKED
jgi:hypothetical protein